MGRQIPGFFVMTRQGPILRQKLGILELYCA